MFEDWVDDFPFEKLEESNLEAGFLFEIVFIPLLTFVVRHC